jgi:hypothetical protein
VREFFFCVAFSTVIEFRTSLRALTMPPANTTGVLPTAPSRVLLIWPNVVTFECVIASVDFQAGGRMIREGNEWPSSSRRTEGRLAGGVDGMNAAAATTGAAQDVDAGQSPQGRRRWERNKVC